MILGVVCPVTGKQISTEQCLQCSLETPLRCTNDTIVLAEATKNREIEELSLSEITSDFLRKTLLHKLLDYYVTPENGYYAVRGKWIHQSKRQVYLSPDLGDTIREKRFWFPDSDVSGQVDIYYAAYRRLVDYKTTSRMPDAPRGQHVRQLQAYVELLRANDLGVDEGFLTYLTYGHHEQMPVTLWSRQHTQSMLGEMVDFYKQCLERREVPPRDLCAGPDRWFMCKYCPFREPCKEHEDWWEIDERTPSSADKTD